MKKIHKNKYPLVRIVWRDSNIYRFQDSIAYALSNYVVESIVTVGFLLGYIEKDPIVTREIMNNGIDQRCSVVIPKENILEFDEIQGDFSSHTEWAKKRMPENADTLLTKNNKPT